jgi:hypothetical protein
MPQPPSMSAASRPDPAAGGASSIGRREARLRPEYARRYPGIQAGLWEPAAELCDRVLASGLLRGAPPGRHGRVLSPEHFEFRGGRPQEERPRREDR